MRKLYTLKAGCILINQEKNKVALIYRKKHNDYEFPKGHLENNENLKECAIRETAEEIKRDAKIIEEISPIILNYRTNKGEACKCYYYLSTDLGNCDNKSTDSHKLIWAEFDKVENILTHKSLKSIWNIARKKIENLFYKNN